MKAAIRLSSLFAIGLAVGAVHLRAADAPLTIRALFLQQLTDVESKINSLAQATPAEKYSWRPADGVRSISEVFTHIAGANYMFPTMAGVKMPEGIDRNMEKTVTEKAKVLEVVKKSFEHARKAVEGLSDADMAKEIKMFGRPATVGGNVLHHGDSHARASRAVDRLRADERRSSSVVGEELARLRSINCCGSEPGRGLPPRNFWNFSPLWM